MIYNAVDRIITSSAYAEAFGDEEDIMMSFGCTKSGSSNSEVAYPRG
jgi:hypothetical protein